MIKDIVKGHVNELLGLNKDISRVRMDICRRCPLFLNELGGICNPRLYLNVETGDVLADLVHNNEEFVVAHGGRGVMLMVVDVDFQQKLDYLEVNVLMVNGNYD